jgi:hypothetical protein
VINEGSFLLTHTVENRCAKIRPISIGKRVTVGCLCAVLPDASMSDGSSLADMSLVSRLVTGLSHQVESIALLPAPVTTL